MELYFKVGFLKVPVGELLLFAVYSLNMTSASSAVQQLLFTGTLKMAFVDQRFKNGILIY